MRSKIFDIMVSGYTCTLNKIKKLRKISRYIIK